MAAIDERLLTFVRAMPKVELHVHLEGSIRPATLLELARRHGVDLPATDPAGLAQWYRFRDFPHFIEVWLKVVACLREPADLARITRELGEDAAAQGVRYLEPTFTPWSHLHFHGVPFDESWGGVREGIDWVERELGLAMRFAADIPRNSRFLDQRRAEMTAEWAVGRQRDGVVSLGIGGNEVGSPPEDYAEAFQYARARGLRSWPHAGETVGPASVWGAVRALGADRIAHGVRAVEDPALLAHLAERRIGCDVCPTSNVQLGVYRSIAEHPIRRLIEAGVPVTVNSDDPPMFGTTLTGELLALAAELAFDADELADLTRTAVEVCFLPDAERAALRARVERELRAAAELAGLALAGELAPPGDAATRAARSPRSPASRAPAASTSD